MIFVLAFCERVGVVPRFELQKPAADRTSRCALEKQNDLLMVRGNSYVSSRVHRAFLACKDRYVLLTYRGVVTTEATTMHHRRARRQTGASCCWMACRRCVRCRASGSTSTQLALALLSWIGRCGRDGVVLAIRNESGPTRGGGLIVFVLAVRQEGRWSTRLWEGWRHRIEGDIGGPAGYDRP